MTAVAFTEPALLNVKRGLKTSFPESRSSHLTEALAAGCGYRSHAALLADLRKSGDADPNFVLLDDEAFVRRLCELRGEPVSEDEDFDWFEYIDYPDKTAVVKTRSSSWYDLTYATPRHRAWRNVMVAAINEGIDRRYFTIRPGDNRWPGCKENPGSFVYRFWVEGIPAIAYVSDIGYAELAIHCALWPTARGEEWIGAFNAGFAAGAVVACGWLERQNGAWLQFSGAPLFHCRRRHLAVIAGLDIVSKGFGDRGDFIS